MNSKLWNKSQVLVYEILFLAMSFWMQIAEPWFTDGVLTDSNWFNFVGAFFACNLLLGVIYLGKLTAEWMLRKQVEKAKLEAEEAAPQRIQVKAESQVSDPVVKAPIAGFIRYEDSETHDPPYCDVCGVNLTSGSCSPHFHKGPSFLEPKS